jgi:hypothetical protein
MRRNHKPVMWLDDGTEVGSPYLSPEIRAYTDNTAALFASTTDGFHYSA